ncbi:MAG: hypothetical protein PHW96_00300 [Candidatus Nanoarchaeia archaeon]|nr:hypothetical protein [Candidatus Nanoarchaeia archaeon]
MKIKETIKITLQLLFLMLIITYSFLLLKTYLHEEGHIIEASKFNITLSLTKINYIPDFSRIDEWGLAEAKPISKLDCENYNSLSKEEKAKINYAGVIYESYLLIPSIILSSILLFSSFKFNKKFKSKKSQFMLSFSILLLILFTSMLLQTLLANAWTDNPIADWNKWYLECSNFT